MRFGITRDVHSIFKSESWISELTDYLMVEIELKRYNTSFANGYIETDYYSLFSLRRRCTMP